MSIETFISIFSAISVAILGYLEWRRSTAKTQADVNAVDLKSFQDLVTKVEAQSKDYVSLQHDISEMKSKMRALWQYVYELIDFIRDNNLIPPKPPSELESDPKLARIIMKK